MEEVAVGIDDIRLAELALDEVHDILQVRLAIVLAVEDASASKSHFLAHV